MVHGPWPHSADAPSMSLLVLRVCGASRSSTKQVSKGWGSGLLLLLCCTSFTLLLNSRSQSKTQNEKIQLSSEYKCSQPCLAMWDCRGLGRVVVEETHWSVGDCPADLQTCPKHKSNFLLLTSLSTSTLLLILV